MLTRALLLLLAAIPSAAQTVGMTGSFSSSVSPVPVVALPSAASALAPGLAPSAALSLTPSLSAPSLTPALQPLSLAALTVTIPAAVKPEQPGKAFTPAAAKKLAAALSPATPLDGWASRFDFKPQAEAFDGSRALKSEAGAVFTAVPKGDGAVRVHLVERAPLSAKKTVPGTEGLSGKALLDALNAITARGYRQHEYNEASDYLFSKADHVTIGGVSGVVDAYSGIFVPGDGKDGGDYPEPGDVNGDGFPDKAGMNVEHTWPQSMFGKALPMRSDLHHLMATFMHPNSVRGSLPFGVVTKPDYENKAGAKRGNGVFEPPDAVKGRVARGLLYFYSRYKDSRTFGRQSQVFWNQQIELLMEWNRRFPPDAFEARRNDLVEAWQGNRNPFIDDYTLADRVGKDAFRVAPGPGGMRVRPSKVSQPR